MSQSNQMTEVLHSVNNKMLIGHPCLRCSELYMSRHIIRDIPGSPPVKTLPSNAEGVGLIPGQGVKIPNAWWPKNQNIKQKQHCDKFNKDLKNGPCKKKMSSGRT